MFPPGAATAPLGSVAMSVHTEFSPQSAGGVDVVAPEEWDDALEGAGCRDVYLRRGYHAASAHLEPDPAGAVLLRHEDAGGAWWLPLVVRALPSGDGFDATSAYGYGGPWATGAPDLAAAGAAVDAWATAHGVVASFLRFQPLLANHAWSPPQARPIALGRTVSWRVGGDRDLRAGMHSHHRRAAGKADRAGVETRVLVAPGDLAGFRALYDVTMRRQGADAFYFFPDAYWRALEGDAGGDVVLVEGLLDGGVVAALLCLAGGGALHYHLGATADAARGVGASNRVFLAAAEWARGAGLEQFHLGGGVGNDTASALHVFKQRYDPEAPQHPFHVAKWVHDPDGYRRAAGTDSTDGYFPPWRGPEAR